MILAGLLLKTGAYGLMRFVACFSACGPRVHSGRSGAGCDRDRLRRRYDFFADRLETPGGIHRVSHLGFVLVGISPRTSCAAGRDYDDDLSRTEHRWLFVLVGGLQNGFTRGIWNVWAGSGLWRRG